MKLKLNLFFWLSAMALVLSACASYQQKVTPELQERVSSLRVVSFLPQSELSVKINTSNSAAHMSHQAGALGALVGAIVDSAANNSATKKAEARAERFRTALQDTDFSSDLHNAFGASINAISWADTVYERRDGEQLGSNRKKLLSEVTEDALLILTSNYGLTPQLESFEIYTQFEFYERNKASNKTGSAQAAKLERVDFGGLKFQSELVVPRVIVASPEKVDAERNRIREEYALKIKRTGDTHKKQALMEIRDKKLRRVEARLSKKVQSDYVPEQGEEVWLANGAARLVETMQAGALEQSTLLSIELSDPYLSKYHRDNLLALPTMRIVPGGAFSGGKTKIQTTTNKAWLVAHENGRKRWRLRNGQLYSVSDGDFVRLMAANIQ